MGEHKLGCMDTYLIKTLLPPFSCWGGKPCCGLFEKGSWDNWWIAKPKASDANQDVEDPLLSPAGGDQDSSSENPSLRRSQSWQYYDHSSPAVSPSSEPAYAGRRSRYSSAARDNVTSPTA